MTELDQWARDHRHRAKRAQIKRLRQSKVAEALASYTREYVHGAIANFIRGRQQEREQKDGSEGSTEVHDAKPG